MTDLNAAGTTESITSSQDHNDLYDPYMTSEDRSMSSQFALVLSTTLEWLEWFGWKTIVLFLINFLCMAVSSKFTIQCKHRVKKIRQSRQTFFQTQPISKIVLNTNLKAV